MRLTPRVAGFRSEYPAGFKLECMAGFVGTRKDDTPFEYKASDWGRLKDGRLVALDYSTPAHLTKEDLEELMHAATWPD